GTEAVAVDRLREACALVAWLVMGVLDPKVQLDLRRRAGLQAIRISGERGQGRFGGQLPRVAEHPVEFIRGCPQISTRGDPVQRLGPSTIEIRLLEQDVKAYPDIQQDQGVAVAAGRQLYTQFRS